jgi:hypothetical protein
MPNLCSKPVKLASLLAVGVVATSCSKSTPVTQPTNNLPSPSPSDTPTPTPFPSDTPSPYPSDTPSETPLPNSSLYDTTLGPITNSGCWHRESDSDQVNYLPQQHGPDGSWTLEIASGSTPTSSNGFPAVYCNMTPKFSGNTLVCAQINVAGWSSDHRDSSLVLQITSQTGVATDSSVITAHYQEWQYFYLSLNIPDEPENDNIQLRATLKDPSTMVDLDVVSVTQTTGKMGCTLPGM